ncbi:hypothetical protein [Microbacterium sp. Bi128]|uniref:hypothetical protein n=1 Tax=Microbacterium sp. Bi128 TaxID=2821115 RepID=UPI001D5285CD|nr:hypothetical protein [Microbacterium sp. Bi128]CAH0131242.1 hypothetical protein SRABI128_00078 [Microbacterium sp. Bi128]
MRTSSLMRRGPLALAAIVALVLGIGLPVAGVGTAQPAVAADASRFDPGLLITDENFYDGAAMSTDDVQKFLDDNNRCGQRSNCLAALRGNTPSMAASRYCQALDGRSQESAASMIARVGAACSISQRTLLVMLQKEQGLITSSNPSQYALDHALGQSCPDTAPCDPAFAGFFTQLYYGARQFQIYRVTATTGGWNYRAGRVNNIGYHPDPRRNCGTKAVFIQNQATAGLYIYTPYTPNDAAMRNLYGEGDQCSAYGNRNFWRMWTDWFGDPTKNTKSPVGVLTEMTATEDGLLLAGWAVDGDALTSPVQIRVDVGGVASYLTADQPYQAVADNFPGAGAAHGFRGVVAGPPGTTQNVCVTMVNQGTGSDQSLGCRAVDLPARVSPRGELKDLWTTTAGIHFWGWAIDPDAVKTTVDLHILVDKTWYVVKADQKYALGPELVAGANYQHGFGAVLPIPAGPHTICLTMINKNAGTNVAFGCRDVTVPSVADVSPQGELQTVSSDGRVLNVSGWVVDPDAASSAVPVIVQVDSQWYRWSADAENRSSLTKFPTAGSSHGYAGTVPIKPGSHWICVYYLNANDGADPAAACRQFSVPQPKDQSPVTRMMGAWPSQNGVTLWGYAFDPDALEGSTDVIVQLDSQWYRWTADRSYAPLTDTYPDAGTERGYVGEIPTTPGLHWLCTYAVNRNAGSDTKPACQQIRTP